MRLKQVEWQILSDEWESSGMNQAAFCQSKGIKLHTFSYWRARLKKPKKLTTTFQPVTLKTPRQKKTMQNLIHLRLPNGISISIPPETDKLFLKNVFELLGINLC